MSNTNKCPTYTHRLEEFLLAADSPLSVKEIAQRSGIPEGAVRSTLDTLHRYYSGADYICECDCRRWFLTPQTDKRAKKIEEQVPQGPGYRNGTAKPRKHTFLSEANAIAEAIRAKREARERQEGGRND